MLPRDFDERPLSEFSSVYLYWKTEGVGFVKTQLICESGLVWRRTFPSRLIPLFSHVVKIFSLHLNPNQPGKEFILILYGDFKTADDEEMFAVDNALVRANFSLRVTSGIIKLCPCVWSGRPPDVWRSFVLLITYAANVAQLVLPYQALS